MEKRNPKKYLGIIGQPIIDTKKCASETPHKVYELMEINLMRMAQV
jgi:hypothetical protein|tara:strand:+ start:43 stop:180 length:138 start_codon:yes stop_codon:yes gene_type:complete